MHFRISIFANTSRNKTPTIDVAYDMRVQMPLDDYCFPLFRTLLTLHFCTTRM